MVDSYLSIGTSISLHGPFFDARGQELIGAATVAARYELADVGVRMVRTKFLEQIKVNRGIFISSVTAIDMSRIMEWDGYQMAVVVDDPQHESVITTENAMYGPWLEGVGSRNETTRFKGYHGFREAAQELEMIAPEIVEEAIRPYVEALNG